MGSSLAIFFQINHFRRFHIQCAQRQEGKQQLSKTYKRKLLTPGKIEKHLVPYNMYSKGDNLKQIEILTEFEAVCWEFLIK